MNTRKPIEVCITIDTEFSIGGNFEDPALTPVAEPMVLGSVGGKEQGLGFLLESLAEFGVRATFFVETLQTAYFGNEPMGGSPALARDPKPTEASCVEEVPVRFHGSSTLFCCSRRHERIVPGPDGLPVLTAIRRHVASQSGWRLLFKNSLSNDHL